MSLLLTAADNQNNTGLTVTVAGSDGGSVNTIWAVNNTIVDVNIALPWSNVGSITGNGSLPIALAPGYYFLAVSGTVSGSPAWAPPIRGVASLANQSLFDYLWNGIVARLQEVNYPTPLSAPPSAMLNANIIKLWKPDAKSLPATVQFPAMIVSPYGNVATDGGTNQQDDIGYSFLVALIDTMESSLLGSEPAYSLWHERTRKALISQRLIGVPQNRQMYARLDSRPMFDWDNTGKFGRLACFNQFRFVDRETRGV
jgi:hypothetical protein